MRSCQKLPPCLIEPMPAGSKTDPPMAKAEPISDDGSTSGITYLSGKPTLEQAPGRPWREEPTLEQGKSVRSPP